MIGEQFGVNPGTIVAVYMALLVFGIGYNWLTALAERHGFMKSYTAFFVVGGVVVTVGLMGFVNLTFAILMAGAFIASGTPMIVGSMVRHQIEERQAIERAKAEARDEHAA